MGAGASGLGFDWSNSTVTLYVGAAIGVLLVAGFVILLLKMRKIRKESRETLAKRYGSGDIICHDNFAQYCGMEIAEGKQVGGKGILVLAQSELYFLRLHPRMELCIPLKQIQKCLTPSSFLGKSVQTPLLKIDFQDEDGVLNSVAWQVRDLRAFENALKLQRKKYRPKKRK